MKLINITRIVKKVLKDPTSTFILASGRLDASVPLVTRFLPLSILTRRWRNLEAARTALRNGNYLEALDFLGNASSQVEKNLRKKILRLRYDSLKAFPASSEISEGSEPMKVLMFLTNSLPSRASGYTLRSHELLMHLKQQGIEVLAVTRPGFGLVPLAEDASVEVVDGISYCRIPESSALNPEESFEHDVLELWKIAASFNPSVLHTTTDFRNGLLIAEVAKRLDLPWVYEKRGSIHETWLAKQMSRQGSDPEKSDYFLAAVEQEESCTRAASHLVVLSEIVAVESTLQGVLDSNISVVPNAISSSEIGRSLAKEAIRSELGLPNCRIFGSATSIVEYEGLDDAIRSLLFLPPDFQLLVVGDGPELGELKRLASNLNVDHRVIFVGRKAKKDIWKWYGALDVFVVPRKDYEVCRKVTPIKSLMAQAMDIPVVASDLPALREITGGFAKYCSPENPEALAKAILVAVDSSPSEEINSWVKAHTWERNATRLSEIYHQLKS